MKMYGVFCGSKWMITTNYLQAMAKAENYLCKGETVEVRWMDYSPDSPYWDCPTFRACSFPMFTIHE